MQAQEPWGPMADPVTLHLHTKAPLLSPFPEGFLLPAAVFIELKTSGPHLLKSLQKCHFCYLLIKTHLSQNWNE